MSRNKGRILSCAALIALVAAGVPTTAVAQDAGTDTQISVAIPQKSLSNGLRQLAEVSGLQLVYDTTINDGRTAPAVSATMTPRNALAAALAGSGLPFQFSGDRSAIISTPGGAEVSTSEEGVRAVGVVNVEGAGRNMPFGQLASPLNGTNGSRDEQATEETGSYTTGAALIGTKLPQGLHENAAFVSVMTAQRTDDQALVGLRDIMEQMNSITTTFGGTSDEFGFESRGFATQSITIDGGISFQRIICFNVT